MKKFKFNLESVLKYRVNTEENEKNVLAGLNAQLAQLVAELANLRSEYAERAREFEELSKQGVTVHEIRSNHAFLKNIEYGMELKIKEIEEQNKIVAKQTAVVVRAMQDTNTLNKLKEKKFTQYTKDVQKSEDKSIEEMASMKNAAAKIAR